MKKSKFQTVIFTIIVVTMNGHTYKLFKNIFNDYLTEGKGEINMVPGQSACLQSMSRMTTMKGFIILAIIATDKHTLVFYLT